MLNKVLKFLYKYALYIAFLQAWAALLGSLYFSEIRKDVPCLLCWYQRILMYPLAAIFPVAILRKDKNVAYYVLPLSIIGVIIAAYQYMLQMTTLSQVTPINCDALGSCSAIQEIFFGFITIPFMSLAAFSTITFLMVLILKFKNDKRS